MEVEGVGKMRSVMLSIKPKYCELIVSGKKTIEVRKTRPKIETPFKCLIYECKGKEVSKIIDIPKEQGGGVLDYYEYEGCGKVIGEFMCDKIYQYTTCDIKDGVDISDEDMTRLSCLTKGEIKDYELSPSKFGIFGWHISDLVIYDKPKVLSKFTNKSSQFTFSKDGALVYKGLKRPPQSWCYVEEKVK